MSSAVHFKLHDYRDCLTVNFDPPTRHFCIISREAKRGLYELELPDDTFHEALFVGQDDAIDVAKQEMEAKWLSKA